MSRAVWREEHRVTEPSPTSNRHWKEVTSFPMTHLQREGIKISHKLQEKRLQNVIIKFEPQSLSGSSKSSSSLQFALCKEPVSLNHWSLMRPWRVIHPFPRLSGSSLELTDDDNANTFPCSFSSSPTEVARSGSSLAPDSDQNDVSKHSQRR